MRKIYIFLFFILVSQNIQSQFSSSSAAYFPLAVGNKWIYKRFHLPAAEYSYLQMTVKKDTIVNGVKYYWLHHTPPQVDYWARIDTTNGILYHYIESPVSYIKLSASQGDTMNYVCSGSVDTVYFNTPTNIKKFYKDLSVPGNNSEGIEIQFAKNFGQSYYYYYYSSFTGSQYLYAWLEGCVINGVLYGDTTFPVGITNISNEMPEGYRLSQNYPNPFNPATQIKFDISKSSFINLTIYDVNGREISVLVNEDLHAGSYTADWDASAYPSGVYFYKIITVDYSETKKMVLIK
jgi:hypothetical protein